MTVLSALFNWVDLILFVVALRFLYKGYQNGLQKELFDCLRMGGVLFVSLSYFLYFSQWIQNKTLIPPTYAKMISYLGLAAITYVGVGLVVKIIGKMGTLSFSRWFDKTATFFVCWLHFGITVGFILFFTMLVPTTFSHEQVYEKSFFGKRVVRLLLQNYTKMVKTMPVSPSRPTLQDFHKTTLSSSVGE